jgi:hypothetical protein
MDVVMPESDRLLEFANLKWTVQLEGKMSLKLSSKSNLEIELKSSGITEVYGFGYIWKISQQNYEKIADVIIIAIGNGLAHRSPNYEPKPYFNEDDRSSNPKSYVHQFHEIHIYDKRS